MTTIEVNPTGKLHKRITAGISDRIRASKRVYGARHDKWRAAEKEALAFLPEKEIDAARRRNRENGGNPQYTTIKIPYSYAIMMTAHTYYTTVFLSRDPVFQVTGRHGESQQSVQAVEALLAYQLQTGGMLVPLNIWLHDAAKYGLGVTGDFWDEEFSVVSEIVEEPRLVLGVLPTNKTRKIKRTRRVPGYIGNRLYNIRPYDWFPDPRVTAANFQRGEFCGAYIELGWNTILKREEQGLYTNVDVIKSRHGNAELSGSASTQREAGAEQLLLPSPETFFFDEVVGRDKSTRGKNSTVLPAYEVCIDLIPSAWGLGRGNLPEKWIVTGKQ